MWSSSLLLLRYIADGRCYPGDSPFKGQRIVELGAGTGLPGMACAKLGGDVVLTDMECVLDVMTENIKANFGNGSSCGSCHTGLSYATETSIFASTLSARSGLVLQTQAPRARSIELFHQVTEV